MGKTTVYVLILCIIAMTAFFIVMEIFRERAPKENIGAERNVNRSEARFVYIAGGGSGQSTDNFTGDFRKSRC